MYRAIDQWLDEWSDSGHRSPLLLCGARQVGKTYALTALGKRRYDNCAYLNLMRDDAKQVFAAGYDARSVIENIHAFTGTRIMPGRTLIVIDEIQEVPAALTLMKAFKEETPEQHIAAAGSYMGVAYHAGRSFPVGKVDLKDMHPLTFLEFLHAVGDEALARVVEQLDMRRAELFGNRLERRLRQYLYIGGMPEAVSAFVAGDNDYEGARRVQSQLLDEYDKDFSKHITNKTLLERTRLAFDSIPAHLGRENHKFIFGHIQRGARAKDFEAAIEVITDSGLASRVYRVDKPALPLRNYRDLSAFKLYLLDVGLLGADMDVDLADVLLRNDALVEYKGAMIGQYVCQQLVASDVTPYYWSRPNAQGEVDFIVKRNGEPAPLEAKAETNVHAKSLRTMCNETGLHGYRTSIKGYREQDWLTNVPLWMVGAYFDPANDPAGSQMPSEAYLSPLSEEEKALLTGSAMKG
ncbi:ATP-binding protein [Bifidobacterium miconisargentati]|uniref:ATP-binding protein n=1 Tax=Bifidobacterium miconisargentati TaxID=2834437 RepID=UPI001BDD3160|nr:ATP-binding protein [Bifidobacterium miconisargentati]MBW3090118.1 ATP-binding protein [Bifidobacterium miconisargentati]